MRCENGTICSNLTEPHSVETCLNQLCPTTTTIQPATTTRQEIDEIVADMRFVLKKQTSTTKTSITTTTTVINKDGLLEKDEMFSSTAVKFADNLTVRTTTTTTTTTTKATTKAATTRPTTKKTKIVTSIRSTQSTPKPGKKKTVKVIKKLPTTTTKKKVVAATTMTPTTATKKKLNQRSLAEELTNNTDLSNFTRQFNETFDSDFSVTFIDNENNKPNLNESLNQTVVFEINNLNETFTTNSSQEILNHTTTELMIANSTFESSFDEPTENKTISNETLILGEEFDNKLKLEDENSIYSSENANNQVDLNEKHFHDEEDEPIEEFGWQTGPFGPVNQKFLL